MIIQFRKNKKPRFIAFIAKDDRWYVCGERDLVEIKDPDRTDDFQDRARADRDRDNLILKGHY